MSSNSTGKVMEYNSSIKEAVGQCAEGLSQCLEIPELEDDWVEDALGSIEDFILSNGLHVSLGASLEPRDLKTVEEILECLGEIGAIIAKFQTQLQAPQPSSDAQLEEPSSTGDTTESLPELMWFFDKVMNNIQKISFARENQVGF
ncbi:hypothetical protein N7520_006052 [Penicillium odoratum]|uniref:uncharacterized protein n=1 Tax=Penicillium odoratum TaxID=1167516 RepID=UPI002548B5D8|nr:uncharacterized protein N7520_006052 [Penicillium odoratum]KAJ5758896.1 hypothetical protein N7520_006052 [Penicillium odoratum]